MVYLRRVSTMTLIMNHSSCCRKRYSGPSPLSLFLLLQRQSFSLKILKLNDMIQHNTLQLVCKSLNNILPSHFYLITSSIVLLYTLMKLVKQLGVTFFNSIGNLQLISFLEAPAGFVVLFS